MGFFSSLNPFSSDSAIFSNPLKVENPLNPLNLVKFDSKAVRETGRLIRDSSGGWLSERGEDLMDEAQDNIENPEKAVAKAAVVAALVYGGIAGYEAYLASTGAAGTGLTTAETVALMEANGLTAAEISAATGGQVAGYTAADVAAMAGAEGATSALTGIDAAMADYAASGGGGGLFGGGETAVGLLDGGTNFGNPEIDNLIPQVDANGGLLGQPSNFGNPEADNLVDQVTSKPPASNFGNPEADNLVPQVDANGNLLGQVPPAVNNPGLLDKVISNPKLIGAVAGALLGGADGGATDGSGEAYTGPMPTITRGGWSPSATPTYMNLPTTDYQLPTTGYANSGLWRFNGQQPQPATQQPYQMPQAPQPFTPQQPAPQQLMQQPMPQQAQHGLLGTQQQPQQQGLMSHGFGRQRQQGTPADLFSLAQQKGWVDQAGAPVGNWQYNVSKLTAAARKMGLNVGGIDQAFGQAPGTTAGYLGTNTLYDGRQRMLDRRAGGIADQEARTQNAGFNKAMSRDNGNGTTGRDTYNAYLMRNGIDWQY